ncbi:hypothetical protein JRO89_XSUnG0084500 [Xanthoceras sorbifolium]|uniref:Cytochrome P450 n=1 Tax=Xanthoceras sorbifolium TaxID=99658 RepID=A0ABQ8GZJ7_9ROSI|nr:hypothetical protein JRO89_XSUnG0084500 [Xanthoceras sorbifolium]
MKKIFPSRFSHKTVALSSYGGIWRVLRRNLVGTEGVLYPPRIKSYSHIRKRVLDNLVAQLNRDSKDGQEIVEDCFQKRLEDVLKSIEILIGSFIQARKKMKQKNEGGNNIESSSSALSYIDTLLELDVQDGNDKVNSLDEADILSLCLEFVNPGTDSISTALQWVMANVVKYSGVQANIFSEMNQVVEQGQEWIKENDLQKMPYLKAVILESLRRHPPVNLVTAPHMVTEDVELAGYLILKGTPVYFWIPDMGRDPNLWDDPMEFNPERFLSSDNNKNGRQNVFDITGNKEIKMMPFGAGRRICPGLGVSMHNLEYLVANLVWCFEWTPVNGENVDLSEKIGLTTDLKNPLRACISPRVR